MNTFKPFCRVLRPLAAALILVSAQGSFGAEVIDRILVRVNSRIITQSAFDNRLEQTIRDGGPPPSGEKREELKKSVMDELVNETLLEDRARDLDLITNDAEIEDQIKRLKEQNNVSTDEDFQKALAASGLTVERLRDQLKKTLTVQRVVGREVNSKVDLSDDALRLVYEREKDTWKVAEKAHLAEILIANGDDATSRQASTLKAREASDKLKAGAKWDATVKEYSEGGTKARGGDLGVVAKGELNPEIDKAVFSLPVNSISEPIATKYGWHIVKVIDKIPASYKPFGEVKADLLKREQETQFQKKLADYLDKLKHEAVIRVSAEAASYYTAPALLQSPPPPPASAADAKKAKKS